MCVCQALHPDMHTNVHCRLVPVHRAVIRGFDRECVCVRPCMLITTIVSACGRDMLSAWPTLTNFMAVSVGWFVSHSTTFSAD